MHPPSHDACILALDGGGTATRAGLFDAEMKLMARAEGGPSNPLIEGKTACLDAITALCGHLLGDRPRDAVTVAAAIAGCARRSVRDPIADALAQRLAVGRLIVSNDLAPVLAANVPHEPAVVVVAGTGSSVLAHNPDGASAILGGRGPVFGDGGSAYGLACAGLQAAARAVDGIGPPTALVEALTKAAGCDTFDELPPWTLESDRRAIARLAATVTEAAAAGDAVAEQCLLDQAEMLAEWTQAGLARLPAEPPPTVLLHGGLLTGCPRYRVAFEAALRRRVPQAMAMTPPIQGIAAVAAAAQMTPLPEGFSERTTGATPPQPELPPTEGRLAEGPYLDRLDAAGIVALMNREDATLAHTVGREAPVIARVIARVAEAFQQGGRLIYIGSGTSGRLGVLDASECPPTFGVDPDRVIGIIAGGDHALRHSIEGAEDDTDAAIADLGRLAPPLGATDVVVGIAASGTTPYVQAGLVWAQDQGAQTALLCCNPACRKDFPLVIALDTGPEVLTGSTRLKAGTATKMALNMISTGALTLSGYVYDGLMVRVRPVNSKLRRRAAGIVATLTGTSREEALDLLDAAEGAIPVAVIAARLGVSMAEARRILERHRGILREALEGGASVKENR